MSARTRTRVLLLTGLAVFSLLIGACGAPATEVAPPPPAEEAPPEAEATTEEEVAPTMARWEEPIVIGWTPPDITGVFKTATDFFQLGADDANQNGFKVELIAQSPATHIAFGDQVAIIEDYIQREVDVIAISPIELEVIKPAVRKANDLGIPVIIVNLLEKQADIEVVSYIGFDNTVAAEVTAYSLLDYFGGPGVLGAGRQVEIEEGQYLDYQFWKDLYGGLSDAEKAEITARGVIIEGVAGGFFSTARLNGFHNVVDQYPGVEVLGVPCAADWNREKGIACTEAFLEANPTNLDFVWAASNEMGLGAMLASSAVDRLELATEGPVLGDEKVAVFTNDVTPESVNRIAEGKIVGETTHGFADWGWFGTKFAVMAVCGMEVPETFDILPRIAFIENARLFYPQPVLPPIDWEEIKSNCP